jgi:transcriptional regulator with XRE-family HTH domain
VSDNDLGIFLRSRREAITPADVGLPTGSRRRTPGLRRSELATLAGISVEYLTRLEQGRDRQPSPQILGALAETLRLDADDCVRLHRMSKSSAAGSGLSCSTAPPPAREVRPTVRALLERLEPTPALLLNRLGDVLARTSGYELLAGPIGLLEADPPNLVRYVFTDPRARTVYPDWDGVADARMASMNLEFTRGDPHIAELVDELSITAGSPFTDRLAEVTALPLRPGIERMLHPVAGELRLAAEVMELPQTDDQRLVVLLPADEATEAALDLLSGLRPGALRAVAG